MKRSNISCPNCGNTNVKDLGSEHRMRWIYWISFESAESTEYRNETDNLRYVCKKCNWPVPAFNPSKRIPR